QSLLGRNAIERFPSVGDDDVVDAPAPRIVLHQSRQTCFGSVAQLENLAGRALSELMQLRLDVGPDVAGQPPANVRAQHLVALVLVAQPRCILKEVRHLVLPCQDHSYIASLALEKLNPRKCRSSAAKSRAFSVTNRAPASRHDAAMSASANKDAARERSTPSRAPSAASARPLST